MAHRQKLLHKVTALCKRRGFVFQCPGVRGDQQGAYDYGPLGAELKRNLIDEWWHAVVRSSGNVHALDSTVLTSLDAMEMVRPLTSTTDAKNALCQALLRDGSTQSASSEDQSSDSAVTAADEGQFQDLYFRPDVRQGAVLHFLECAKSLGLRLPFGIAEVGRVFRKEARLQYFLFRMCEFEQLSLQFFCSPSEDREWYAHWQKRRLRWWKRFANSPESFLLSEEPQDGATVQQSSIQFRYPWGRSKVESIANGADADLKKLSEAMEDSGSSLKRAKVEGTEKAFPCTISLAAGVDRALLAYLCDAYTETKRPYVSEGKLRVGTVLKLHTCLAPYKVAVLPMEESNQKLCVYCRMLADELRHVGIHTVYSDVGSFEYRLAVQDEIGTPYRIMADDNTLQTGIVGLQHRDTTIKEEMNGQDVLPSVQKMLLGARLN